MRLLKSAEVADLLGVSGETLAHWRYLDKGLANQGRAVRHGPPFIAPNGRFIGYLESDVEAWLSQSRVA